MFEGRDGRGGWGGGGEKREMRREGKSERESVREIRSDPFAFLYLVLILESAD